jgi:xylulokinase
MEAVAVGAARQAAWALAGSERPPAWAARDLEHYEADRDLVVRERYAEARGHVLGLAGTDGR